MNYENFHLVTVLSNPCNYEKRYENYELFRATLPAWVTLWTIELVTGARKPRIEQKSEAHYHVTLYQSAIDGETWQKENLINICNTFIVERCPDVRYFGWADSDILFEPDAFEKIVDALQTWPVVQSWSHLVNLGPNGEALSILKGYVYCRYNKETPNSNDAQYPPKIGAPGAAWAFRREYLNQFGCAISGPLLDFGILGSGDTYFAHACFGEIDKVINAGFSPGYKSWLRQYEANLLPVLKKNVGYVNNTVRHLFHNSYTNRGYGWRNNILVKYQYDPQTDLTRDISNLWRLVVQSERQIGLRDDMRMYNRSRNDDKNTM